MTRRNGKPRTQAQRRARHTSKYGAKSKLPRRGTGRRR